MRQRCQHTAGYIEKEELEVPQCILDVVAEYPQIQHVPGDVHEPAVH